MSEHESIRNRPRLELTVRKNTSLTGAPLCPACGQELPKEAKFCGHCGHRTGDPVAPAPAGGGFTPPRVIVTKDRHNRGRGNFLDAVLRVVIIIVLLIAAALVVLYVQDRYQDAEGRPEIVTPTNAPTFAAACRSLTADVLAPLDAPTPAPDAALSSLHSRARAAAADPETAALGRLAVELTDRLDAAARKRSELKQEEIRVLNRPAPTLNPDPAEQKRVREFQYRELGRSWNTFATAQRDPLNRLLADLERAEKQAAAPRQVIYPSAWDKLTGWMKSLVGRTPPPARAPAPAR